VLPVEVVIHTHQVRTFQKDLNNKAPRETLDLLPIMRGDAYLKEETTKIRMTGSTTPRSRRDPKGR